MGTSAASTGTLRSSVVRSIDAVDAEAWNALAGDNVFTSHGWLRSTEQFAKDYHPRYVLLHRGDELVGASVCDTLAADQAGFSPDRLMLRRFHRHARRLGISWEPATSCIAFRSYRDHLMVRPELAGPERRAMQEHLLDAVEEETLGRGQALWLPRVSTDDDTIELLRDRGYHETRTNPVAYMDIEWDSVDGYVDHVRRVVSRNAAKTVRFELKRFPRTDTVIEEIDEPERHRDRLFELADHHHRRKNGVEVPYTPDFLPSLKRNMGPDVVIYGAFRRGELIGFSTLFRRNGVAFVPYTGIDPEAVRESFAYFHLCYYRPIMDGIETGLRRLYSGTALYTMKTRRGFSVQPLRVLFRSASPLRHAALLPLFRAHEAWRARKVRLRGSEDTERLRRMKIG